MAEQDVTLNPGESKAITFEAVPHDAKTYQVSVNGLTGSFEAYVGIAEFEYVSAPIVEPTSIPKQVEIEVEIKNVGNAPGACTLASYTRALHILSKPMVWIHDLRPAVQNT
ncbi:unnamed protein product [marine sediment metagenome]|uniref:CARDB domain-containing protein n=1 Tax=marine sediment metagenome TaxID=412755 RepID=X1LX18_9ZZZZ